MKYHDNCKYVTVCGSCMMASCWQGVFYCEDYLKANTVEISIEELKQMNLESPDYWKEYGIYIDS